MNSRIVLLCCTLITLGALAIAQKSNIATVPAPRTSATSGKEIYMAHCATCHGREGKGDGPVAGALRTPPTDLTLLSERNQGRSPSVQVVNVITGSAGVAAHGSKEMSVWGPIFLAMAHQHESEAPLRVANLADYLKSLQKK